uniref:Uncharacterized protein n=1 Tax=Arundo donax TaxID=35708 RepID=A0A0A9GI50_ARUDO
MFLCLFFSIVHVLFHYVHHRFIFVLSKVLSMTVVMILFLCKSTYISQSLLFKDRSNFHMELYSLVTILKVHFESNST